MYQYPLIINKPSDSYEIYQHDENDKETIQLTSAIERKVSLECLELRFATDFFGVRAAGPRAAYDPRALSLDHALQDRGFLAHTFRDARALHQTFPD